MPLIQRYSGAPLKLRLARDLTRIIKRGNPWVFADALRHLPPASPGTPAILLDNKQGKPIARGYYHPRSSLSFRVCATEPDQQLTDGWARRQLERALALRQTFFDETTTGYRLFNGEGDGLPGLIADIYADTAVLQLDGDGPAGFWHAPGIADWLAERLSLRRVYLRPQSRAEADSNGQLLIGPPPKKPISFLENNLHFTVDVVQGQKTGFFLDQRDNRQRIGRVSAGCRVLNLFGYTGGFSVYAGVGHADHVTTVDVAGPALTAADQHWQLNGLPAERHQSVRADAFDYLEKARNQKKQWELVVIDPPSFAPSNQAVPNALKAYRKLIAAGGAVTTVDGLLAISSCSSHIRPEALLSAVEEGVSLARRRATLLGVYDQPPDHPTPLVLPEFRYLQFILMRME